MDTYKIDLKCKNCGKKTNTEIPKGTTIEEHGKKKDPICDNCGCFIIRTE